MQAHLSEPAPTAPAPLQAVVKRALRKEPGARFSSAGELARAALAAVSR